MSGYAVQINLGKKQFRTTESAATPEAAFKQSAAYLRALGYSGAITKTKVRAIRRKETKQ